MIYLCRWFEWDAVKSGDVHGWGLKSSEKILDQLEDVGQQLALTFNDEGSVLAVGGEVGFIILAISSSLWFALVSHIKQKHIGELGMGFYFLVILLLCWKFKLYLMQFNAMASIFNTIQLICRNKLSSICNRNILLMI